MQLIEKFIIPPTANHIELSGYIVLLTLVVYLPFLSLFLGGSLFSMVFNLIGTGEGNTTYVRFSRRILDTFIFSKYVGALFGLLPLFVLYLSLSQMFYDSGLQLSNFFIPLIFIMAAGLALILGYRFSYKFRSSQLLTHISLGLLGLVFLIVSTHILVSVISLIVNFENRFFVRDFTGLVLSWNATARFTLFLSLTLGITGAGLLLFSSGAIETGRGVDETLGEFTKKVGASSCTLSVLITPLFTLWYLFTLPQAAVSWKLVFSAILFFLALVAAFLSLEKTKARPVTNASWALFAIFFVSYSLSTTGDFLSFNKSAREHLKFLPMRVQKVRERAAEAHGESKAKEKKDLERLGESIFTNRCSACHQYGAKVVGPPFLKVLPKYKGSKDELAAFIQNPVKKDPDYPPMPSLGLTRAEAKAVADYVLKRLEKEASM